MSERRAAIVRLLDARFEHLPEPVRRSEISSGFVHGLDPKGKPWRWLSCPDCLANDRVMFGCETCGGRGQIPDPGRDPMASTAIVAYGADGSKHDLSYARDREIERLGQQLRPPPTAAELLDEANERGYVWEEARRRLYRSTDLTALDRAVEWLRGFLPGVSLYGGLALGFFDVVLPNPLRAPEQQAPVVNVAAHGRGADPRALEQRNAMVRAEIEAGVPTAEVAAAFGLSVRQVNNIVQQAAA